MIYLFLENEQEKKMLPSEEEMKEFVKEVPKTAAGKLEAMNKLVFKEKSSEEAFKQMLLFFEDLMKNNPEYFEALKRCKTEEEIKNASEEFFKNNPAMTDEVMLSMLAVKRDKWEQKEKDK